MLSFYLADGCGSAVTVIPPQVVGGLDVVLLWAESDIGHTEIVNCPCGNLTLTGGVPFTASRYCGGNFAMGAAWAEPQSERCNFTETARQLCKLTSVRALPIKISDLSFWLVF